MPATGVPEEVAMKKFIYMRKVYMNALERIEMFVAEYD